jgi:hypothetical protein
MFPYTNGLDDVGTESDVILNMGTPFCHWFNETSGPTECFVGVGGKCDGLVPKSPLADHASIAWYSQATRW